MLQFKNTTPFQGKIWLLPDPEGIDSIYTVVKATFVLGVKPVLAEKQATVNLQDEYHGEPGQSSLKAASDLGLIKPASDVMLLGTAFASKGQKTTQMEVSLTVGPVVKKVLVFGDRAWQSGLVGSRPSAPTPFATMPLIWERAFGGNDRTEGDKPEMYAEARNPVGAGFRHAKGLKKLDGLKLPNLEDPKQPIAGWKDRSTPVCFAPICAHWEPRRAYVGTYDDAWKKKRDPYVPKDFNARFFQLAPPDLQVPGYLKGGEPVEILGATPNGSLRFQLPEARIQVTYRLDNQDHVGAANLDTVLIEPDQSRLVLVWRSVFACDKRALRVRRGGSRSGPGTTGEMTLAQQDVVILGVGMSTAVGLTAPETAASVAAATMRFSQIEWRDGQYQPYTVASVPEDGLPDLAEEVGGEPRLTYREVRLLRLGTMPILESVQVLGAAGKKTKLFLALPEMETKLTLDRDRFLKHLWIQTKEAFSLPNSQAGFLGRAGGLLALGKAIDQVRSGQDRFALAGGIDTLLDLYVLDGLDHKRRVKSTRNLDGFIPGEGAGFVLVGNRQAAESAKLAILARVSPVATGMEPGHLDSEEPYRGEGLAETLAKFHQDNGPQGPIQEVFSSMNGESYWAKEWGVALVRHKEGFAPDHQMRHPADCFGDTGAACGPLLVGLAAQGLAKKNRRGPCLIYGSSDRGERAVLTVTEP